MNKSLQYSLADMQGKLFELSADDGYDSECFIKLFMTSSIAAKLDSEFDFLQWAGKEYIFEKMKAEFGDSLIKNKSVFDKETLFWIGYVYRLWHFYTNESSKTIFKKASAKKMNVSYLNYHTMDVELAIELLRGKENGKQKVMGESQRVIEL